MAYHSKTMFAFGPEFRARLLEIAVERGTDSAEWRADVDAAAPRMHDEAFARETAALVARTFDRWKVKLPPRPTSAA